MKRRVVAFCADNASIAVQCCEQACRAACITIGEFVVMMQDTADQLLSVCEHVSQTELLAMATEETRCVVTDCMG
jgi:hypothetical protein